MGTGREIAIRPVVELTPQDVVESATIQAKLLMNIVEQQHCYQEISGKKYLQVEAWETIGAFNRTHAETESIIPIIKEGDTIGYQARVQLWKDGIVVGGAIMPCYFTENCCKGKEGDAKHKACISAAQTFATSKAYRMNFSYVAILAGYQPTPAEEMIVDVETSSAGKGHWCAEHQAVFFKKGNMKGYAHPIGDTKKWCNEQKEETSPPITVLEPPLDAPKSTPQPLAEKTGSKPLTEITGDPKTEEELLNWFAKKRKIMDTKGMRTWMVNRYKLSEGAFNDIPSLTAKIKTEEKW